jgi:hypothetical protein
VSIERLIAYERLTTPGEHLGVLFEPPVDRLAPVVVTDRTAGLRSAVLLDTSIAELRQQLRQRLEFLAPVVLTGHQPEFVHAGVFAKVVAVDALASRLGTTGIYLSVDFDLPKTTRLAVPRVDEGDVRREPIPIPGCDPRFPFESQQQVPIGEWRDFFERVAQSLGNAESILHDYIGGIREPENACRERAGQVSGVPIDRSEDGLPLGPTKSSARDALSLPEVIERGQAAVVRALGLALPRRLRASRLSGAPEFRAFLAHIVLNAAGFAQTYNEAQRGYRTRRRVRNPQRPAPLLRSDGNRVELPFWISRERQPRQRLFVAQRGDRIDVFADDTLVGSEPATRLRSATSHAEPWSIERNGWRVRPRALTLSAFARLFVSDLFVHGIGGARYDEMTEDFVQRFFGVELPPACCVSATAYLPLPRHGVDRRTLAAARHAQHDLRFNPQRHLSDLSRSWLERRAELIRASRRLSLERCAQRAERRRVFDEIRAVNLELLRSQPAQVATLRQQWVRLERQYRSDLVALDREYFFAFHPRSTMQRLVERVRAKVSPTGNRQLRTEN